MVKWLTNDLASVTTLGTLLGRVRSYLFFLLNSFKRLQKKSPARKMYDFSVVSYFESFQKKVREQKV